MRALLARFTGPGARAAIATAMIVMGLSEMMRFAQYVGDALDARADELARLDGLISQNREALHRAGVIPFPDDWSVVGGVDLDVSRETSPAAAAAEDLDDVVAER